MAYIEWSDDFKLGFAEIDSQHRWLVEATNALHEELNKGTPCPEEVVDLLNFLVDYTLTHFVTEELLFEWHHFPQRDEHTEEHQAFVRTVRAWMQRHQSGERLGAEILEYLKTWLVEHIQKSDRAYVPFLKSKGVT